MTPEQQKIEAYLQMIEKRGTLDGRFANVTRIDSVGGGGFFSLVCTARDLTTNNEVVLKFFRPDRYIPSDAYRWESFERESKILEMLTGCRDIVTLVAPQAEFVETPIPHIPLEIRFAYYAVEKADKSLADEIAVGGNKAEELLVMFRAIVRSVQRIHSRQIAHRDLKPGNFLVMSGTIKLSDFGTARLMDQTAMALLTNYTYPPGDQGYCSPEMMACLHDVDPKFAFHGDFFAVGAILFEMFTGVNLGVQLFGPQLLTALTQPMLIVPRDQRIEIFNQIIPSISKKYLLPTIDAINFGLPACICQQLNRLFRELCELDYRKRLTNYSSIFRGIDTCLLILRNETRYIAWQKEKQKRRTARMARNGVSK